MASFALPNMLPNSASLERRPKRGSPSLTKVRAPRFAVLYANAQTFFNIPQQMQAFQTQIQQQSQQTQRRSLFSPYLPAASLSPLLAAGKLVIGVLRVNKRVRQPRDPSPQPVADSARRSILSAEPFRRLRRD
jgi:protein SSD1